MDVTQEKYIIDTVNAVISCCSRLIEIEPRKQDPYVRDLSLSVAVFERLCKACLAVQSVAALCPSVPSIDDPYVRGLFGIYVNVNFAYCLQCITILMTCYARLG